MGSVANRTTLGWGRLADGHTFAPQIAGPLGGNRSLKFLARVALERLPSR
jgi:hypothetical protein